MAQHLDEQVLFSTGPGAGCPLQARTRRSQIGVTRHRAGHGGEASASAPAQDAHVVILQLQDLAAHELWADGRYRFVPPCPTGSMTILDLRQQVTAHFYDSVDSLHLHLPRAALEDMAEQAGTAVPDLTLDRMTMTDDGTFRALHPLLVAALDAPAAADSLFVDHLVMAAAHHIASAYGGMRTRSTTIRHIAKGHIAPWQVRRAKDLLATDMGQDMPLLDIATACGLSVAHFARGFRKTTGTTPHGWRQHCRVERAQVLLREDLPLAEIALACGFADQSHLTRVFKRIVGLGPGHWRRLHRGQ